MEPCYRHLTKDDRIVIGTLLQEGCTKKHIAQVIGFDLSTVKRELRRNTGLRGYRPKQAQEMADERKLKPRSVKMTPQVMAYIDAKLREDLSPEQVSDTMETVLGTRVSHERIYRHLWQDKRQGGTLYAHLRIAGGKKRRKRYGKKDWRGRIPGRVGLEERPAIVERKERFGDWEADLVSGARHHGFLVTLVERKSKVPWIGHVERKPSESVRDEVIRLMREYGWAVHTITYDNGHEFSLHGEVNSALGCRSYFAVP